MKRTDVIKLRRIHSTDKRLAHIKRIQHMDGKQKTIAPETANVLYRFRLLDSIKNLCSEC